MMQMHSMRQSAQGAQPQRPQSVRGRPLGGQRSDARGLFRGATFTASKHCEETRDPCMSTDLGLAYARRCEPIIHTPRRHPADA